MTSWFEKQSFAQMIVTLFEVAPLFEDGVAGDGWQAGDWDT